MPELKDLAPLLDPPLRELDKRAQTSQLNNAYIEGTSPVPMAVSSAKMTRAYQALMGMAQAPWADLVVASVLDRLEVGGVETGDRVLNDALWGIWRTNGLDTESKLAHHSALVDGRVFATIWPGDDDQPEIVFDPADQVVVQYVEGRHLPRYRTAALRRWVDDAGRRNVTLYTRTELYKLVEADEKDTRRDQQVSAGGHWWKKRVELGRDGMAEPWPLENPFGLVPVVEIATNRRLKPGAFPYARGEFEHCTGLIDRINLLTFLGLVVAVWMGFPLRGVIGDKIIRDDDNNPVAPFDAKPDEVAQFENPNAKVFQLEAADRKNLSVFAELAQLAYVTKTPAHYFPSDGGFSNISADTIRALEGGLHAKNDGIHKPQLGGGHEELLRVAALMLPDPVAVPPTTKVLWVPRASRSIAEGADAATKLKDLFPWTFIAEYALGLGQDQIRALEAERAAGVFETLLAGATEQNRQDESDEVAEPVAAGES